MRRASATRFRYFPASAESAWGLQVSTVGVSRIAPGERYPPTDHPGAYRLDWELGRTLEEFQIVYISEGEGLLEGRGFTATVYAGELFLLQPGQWHRFRPAPETGWQEHWVGFDGPWARRTLRAFPRSTLVKVRPADERPLADAFHLLQQGSESNVPALEQVLAGYTLSLIGLLHSATRPAQRGRDDEAATMQRAVALLSGPKADSVDLQALATSLHMSYSRFRSTFTRRVGMSPHQLRLHGKLVRARDLLRGTGLSVKEVGDRTGFASEQYFCRIFKQHVGCTPSSFRKLPR